MGRAKVIMSHCRNINMEMTQKFIRYRIPIYSEKESLGKIISTEVKDGEIVIMYENKGDVKPVSNIKFIDEDLMVNFN